MSIRPATIDDLPEVMSMAMRFHDNSPYCDYRMPWNFPEIETTARKAIEEGTCLLYIEHDRVCGMIVFLVFKHFISGELTAAEIALWMNEECRGRGPILVIEAERIARVKGAVAMQMVSFNDKVNKLYGLLGYDLVEYGHLKRL